MSEEKPVPTKGMRIIGHVLSVLSILFLLFSASGKFFKPERMEVNVTPLGWRMDQMTTLGIVELACIVFYAIPQTSVFGAILLTAYLGGATATHARIDQPFIIPIILGGVMWLGLYLREPRLWPLTPIRK
ncbi:MAG: DoxX family protein [Pyrinomonadaceae bacterium]|nr:DoxX family protein [Pyrinomonadaceae bacterium]